MESYKREFIQFLESAGVLKFGDFTAKSGRKIPYFINAGDIKTGDQICKLGEFYAKAYLEKLGNKKTVLYGPAYKGIPIAVSAAAALSREGLDLPEVSLVAILDADKEGFLRSETSLIQTIGRAARNAEGMGIMYADTVTGSMRRAIDETNRRRKIQSEYNEEHGIVPKTIKKAVHEVIEATVYEEDVEETRENREEIMRRLTEEMQRAAKELRFEDAARLRDKLQRMEAE